MSKCVLTLSIHSEHYSLQANGLRQSGWAILKPKCFLCLKGLCELLAIVLVKASGIVIGDLGQGRYTAVKIQTKIDRQLWVLISRLCFQCVFVQD